MDLLLRAANAFASVVEEAMGSKLGDYRTAIADHRAKWEEFEDEYHTVFKAGPRSALTPKQAVLWLEVPKFLDDTQRPLTAYSEQAFETCHQLYTKHADNHKIPRTGMEIVAGRRRKTSNPNFGKHEAAAADVDPKDLPRRCIGNVAVAKKRRRESLLSFNVDRLPDEGLPSKRQRIALAIALGNGERHLVNGVAPWNVFA